MTPGPLRPESVQRRLVEMLALLDVLRRHAGSTGAQLRGDLERRLLVERALQQLVDLAVKINVHVATAEGQPPPADYHSSFDAAAAVGLIDHELAERLAPSTGLRNRLVHEYEAVNHDIVAGAIGNAVTSYDAYVDEVAGWLQRRSAARRSRDP